ncbi:ecotropic viral integration site 5 ortholog-like isoform X2 [Centruroides vittatus]|uniref:ecotropic viral integration site 5 ortholog-like isoform X2 n=1 Tax=Centruroides vittatus TaxID=120091 RepID=UPI00350ED3B3
MTTHSNSPPSPVIKLGDGDSDSPISSFNNNKLSKEEMELLARLEEQNRLLESDTKSLNSLASGHSRRSSDTSQVSVTSGTSIHSNGQEDETEDVWIMWGRIANEWDTYIKKKSSYVKEMVRKGIPQHFRSIIWQLLCNAQTCSAKDLYADYMKSVSPCEKVILRDIARTYPEHEYFREKNGPGQESLFNVMKAYSLYDSEVGYCQGSAFIVGLLLLQMPEEEAFTVFVRLMQDYKLRDMYKPSMAELGLSMYQLECILQEQNTELYRHFQNQSFHTSMYASSWFLTLFTSTLPLSLASRVMDLFLSEGMEMIFRIAVAILQFCKEDLLQLDMEGMLKYFQKEMPAKCEIDPDFLINLALQVKFNGKKLKKMEKEYTLLKVKEQEEMIELRRLRTENKILRQRIENLEQESSALADKLIQGQVSRAQEAEDNFTIKRELVLLKQQELDVQQKLEEAKKEIKHLNEINSQPPSLDEETERLVQSLQDELVAVKLKEAETQETMKEIKQRIQELEETNKQLREMKPDNDIANLQEDLIVVKLREAEAKLFVKELRQKVADLKAMWEKHLEESQADASNNKKKDKTTVSQLQEELMSAKLSETEAVAELKELRQKVMELETQNQVSLNQIRRQAEQIQNLQQRAEQKEERERELQHLLQEEKRRLTDIESKEKEQQMMSRIREVEQEQIIAEMRQKISALEIKNQEIMTARQLRGGVENDEVKELQDRIVELQGEITRLENLNKQLTSAIAYNTYQNDGMTSGSNENRGDNSINRLTNLLDNHLIYSRNNGTGDDVLNEHLLLQLNQKGLIKAVNGEV